MIKDPSESMTFGRSLLLRVDGAIGAMSLSPNGRDAVLAGRRGLFIIDLDDPFTTPRWLHHITSWEVADVQWSPHHNSKPSWCISTSNQKALLWDLSRPSNNAILHVLHKHTRAITDINFHPSDPEVLATCSIDTFVYAWDMRCPRRPVSQWAEWRAGATQVKWNHENPHEIASSHDNSFYIWDDRKGALPVVKVSMAHRGKINGLDFSNGSLNIITCSNDHTVKFWNLKSERSKKYIDEFNFFSSDHHHHNNGSSGGNNGNIDTIGGPLEPSVVIHTDFPVARARSLPFGTDKACGIMPLRGGGDAIHVSNYDNAYNEAIEIGKTVEIQMNPVYSFNGHEGSIKDFLWRTRHEKYEGITDNSSQHNDFQLVTWSSQDYDLKLWPHSDELYKEVNYNPSHQNLLPETVPDESKDDKNVSTPFTYETYITEPPVTIDDITKGNKNDLLSSMTMYQIVKKNFKQQHGSNQLNHLDWISGVRMGKTANNNNNNPSNHYNTNNNANNNPANNLNNLSDSANLIGNVDSHNASLEEDSGPSNLGEEVSYVGHKFPKIRFEKISVSTGELIISLRGPISSEPDESSTNAESSNTGGENELTKDKIVESQGETDNDKEVTDDKRSNAETTSVVNTTANTSITNASAGGLPNAGSSHISNIGNLQTPANVDEDTNEQKLAFIRMKVKFPKNYPHLEQLPSSATTSAKQMLKLQKINLIKFNIEETHELTSSIRLKMLDTLNDIAEFYTNKYQRFCLEPCLRFLMGDKIDLTDSILMELDNAIAEDDEEGEIEIGTEGWADDLINQQPDVNYNVNEINDDNEYEYDDFDLMPAVQEDDMKSSTDSLQKNYLISAGNQRTDEINGDLTEKPSAPLFDSTPVPKGCGAMWTHTGQLVCFFIPKENAEEENTKALQKFNIFKFTDGGFSVNTNNGHHHHSHRRNPSKDDSEELQSLSSGTESEEDLETDEESYDYEDEFDKDDSNDSYSDSDSSSSSEESFTNDWDDILLGDVTTRTRIPGLFKTSVGLGNRYIARGGGRVGSGTGTGGQFSGGRSLVKFQSNGNTSNRQSSLHGTIGGNSNKKKSKKSKGSKANLNIVGIFDLRHLIPDKYELACEYRVLGDSPEKLAKYNAEIAFKYGLKEIGDVWKILEMVLIKDVEINEIKPVYYSPEAVGVGGSYKIEALNQLINNSGIIKRAGTTPTDKSYRFYWGAHPFGHAWLIDQIFRYFEKLGNNQMLAMLSCILYENSNNLKNVSGSNGDVINVPIHTPYGALPPPPSVIALRHYGTSLAQENGRNYSFDEEISYLQNGSNSFQFDRHRNASAGLVIQTGSAGAMGSFHALSGLSPGPFFARSNSSIDGESLKDGTSPEKFGSNFRKPIQHSITLNSFSEYGTPAYDIADNNNISTHRNKFISRRSTTFQSETQQQRRRGVGNSSGGGGFNVDYAKKQIMATPNTPYIKTRARNPPIVTLELLNTDSLDLYDDVYTQSLLGSSNEEKVKIYREQYADLLYIWGLPISRIKILKFNYPNVDKIEGYKSPFDVHSGSFGIRKKQGKRNAYVSDDTSARFVTPVTTSLNQPQAWNSSKTNFLKYCNLCGLPVTKRLVICTNCEHVLHSHCAAEWWSTEEETVIVDGEDADEEKELQECPSGCGCHCLSHRL